MGKTPPTLLIHMLSSDSSAQEALQEDHKRGQVSKKGQIGRNLPVKAYNHHWNQETTELASKEVIASLSH